MKSTIFTASVLLLLVTSGIANAVPFTFQSGNPARATEVNNNFTYLENLIQTNTTNINTNAGNITTNANNIAANTAAIAAIPGLTTYDYRDYATAASITSKTFAITGISTCDTETRNFSRITTGADTTTTMTRIRTQAGSPCQYAVFNFLSTPIGHFMLSESTYNIDGSVLGRTVTLDTPALLQGTAMRIGITNADAATTTITSGNSPTGTYVERTTVVGVETITVPYGTLSNCLKVHSSREASEGFGSGDLSRVSWLCPGVGLAKRIQANGGTWVLTNVTP